MNNKVMKYASRNKRDQYFRAVKRESKEWSLPHRFKMFRTGEDICGICGKPRAEHRVPDTRGDERG